MVSPLLLPDCPAAPRPKVLSYWLFTDLSCAVPTRALLPLLAQPASDDRRAAPALPARALAVLQAALMDEPLQEEFSKLRGALLRCCLWCAAPPRSPWRRRARPICSRSRGCCSGRGRCCGRWARTASCCA
jgi:hypothetical protein